MEYKAVPIAGVTKDAGEGDGIITAIVSVTGVKDNVNDVILPGAYDMTLKTREPKGVWQHNWEQPVSKTLDIKELLPGDSDLPKSLPDGTAWPEGAGALQVKMEFNMKTDRGRNAYEDVLFYGDKQEWSIGYQVPQGGAQYDSKSGTRTINKVELFEFSPVLFGAMPVARTKSFRDIQMMYKSLEHRVEKKSRFEADPDDDVEDDAFLGDEDFEEEDPEGLDDLSEKKAPATQTKAANKDDEGYDDNGDFVGDVIDPDQVRKVVSLMEEELKKTSADPAATKGMGIYIETKATNYDTLQSALRDLIDEPSPKLIRFAVNFDNSVQEKDLLCAKELEDDICDMLEKSLGSSNLEDETTMRVAARVLADRLDTLVEPDGDPQWKAGAYHTEAKSFVDIMNNDNWSRDHGVLFKGDKRVYDSAAFAATLNNGDLKDLAAFSMKVNDFVLHDTAVAELRGRQQVKRTFTQDQRDKAAEDKHAMPDGSYPIENEGDLANALNAIGRTDPSKRAAVKAHIKKQAKRLGLEEKLPENMESYGEPDKDDESKSLSADELDVLKGYAGISD